LRFSSRLASIPFEKLRFGTIARFAPVCIHMEDSCTSSAGFCQDRMPRFQSGKTWAHSISTLSHPLSTLDSHRTFNSCPTAFQSRGCFRSSLPVKYHGF
jgi:hypothetical protein